MPCSRCSSSAAPAPANAPAQGFKCWRGLSWRDPAGTRCRAPGWGSRGEGWRVTLLARRAAEPC